MIKLKEIINSLDSNLIWMYHGGRKWESYNATVQKPSKGRYESGPGIYLTTHYQTAQKYAKRPNIISLVGVSKNLTLSDDVELNVEELVQFINTYISPKYRKDFISTIQKRGKNTYNASYLNNLVVNYEIGGKQAMYVLKFLVDNGVDATLTYNPWRHEDKWLIVHNPEKIKKVIHTKPSDISVNDYVLNGMDNRKNIR